MLGSGSVGTFTKEWNRQSRSEAEYRVTGHDDTWGAPERIGEGGQIGHESVDVVDSAVNPNVFTARQLRNGRARPGGQYEIVAPQHGPGGRNKGGGIRLAGRCDGVCRADSDHRGVWGRIRGSGFVRSWHQHPFEAGQL